MVIDCHTHAYTEEELQKLQSSMKKAGIDKSIIFYWPFEDWDIKTKMPSMSEISYRISKYPNLFLVGSIHVINNKKFKNDLKELDILLTKKKIIGIKLYTGYEHFYANDPIIEPILKLCLKHDVPVMFHMGDCWITESTKDAMIKYSYPIYVDETAVRYPKLKIIICHLGNPWCAEAAMIIAKNKNVYADISGMLSYDRKNKRNDDDLIKKCIMDSILWCNGVDKLLFGTDYNIFDQKDYIDFVKTLKLDKKEFKMLLEDNARKVFSI
jgi:predicted TIM-barrel fold metal-dependent hydrolase